MEFHQASIYTTLGRHSEGQSERRKLLLSDAIEWSLNFPRSQHNRVATHWRCLCSGRAICGGTLTKRSLSSSPTGLLVSPRIFSSCSVTLGVAFFSQRSRRSSLTSSTHCTSCQQVRLQFRDRYRTGVGRLNTQACTWKCTQQWRKKTRAVPILLFPLPKWYFSLEYQPIPICHQWYILSLLILWCGVLDKAASSYITSTES